MQADKKNREKQGDAERSEEMPQTRCKIAKIAIGDPSTTRRWPTLPFLFTISKYNCNP
jgi:hypothetical protein